MEGFWIDKIQPTYRHLCKMHVVFLLFVYNTVTDFN